jgi:epoxyqueuosine reductase
LLHPSQYKQFILSQARELGFTHCGFAKAQLLSDDAKRLEKWLTDKRHGTMHYMESHFDLRIDPTKLVPGAKSVITLLFNYFTTEQQQADYKISKYAYGKDYHFVIKEKLQSLIQSMETSIGKINGRGFVDSAPVLERSWAVKAGLGWVGKNGNLINKQNGSFFFIATLITDVDIEADVPFQKDYCGTCTACIDHCPTDAILPNKEIDGSKCISYYTIELKDALIDESQKGKFDHWMFGCDTCQDVCPWNRFSKQHQEPHFKPINEILNYSNADWEALTQDQFSKILKHSAIKRTKYSGLMRNIKFLASSPLKEEN